MKDKILIFILAFVFFMLMSAAFFAPVISIITGGEYSTALKGLVLVSAVTAAIITKQSKL